MDDRELMWKQYQLNVDLYRSYLELVLKINLFYYAITGAIVSFYFAHESESLVRFSLVLPLVMSVAFSGFFVYGAILSRHTRTEIFKIRDALGFQTAPEVRVLIVFLWIFAVIFALVAAMLLWLVLFR
ncbi:MAG: hypothetical protein AABZ11_04520 [Nitrospinota bacterium]